jgi:hypothetical protein
VKEGKISVLFPEFCALETSSSFSVKLSDSLGSSFGKTVIEKTCFSSWYSKITFVAALINQMFLLHIGHNT